MGDMFIAIFGAMQDHDAIPHGVLSNEIILH
jgi:hypothetical protein